MPQFKLAQPIFIKDKSREMNYTAGFVTKFNAVEGSAYTLSLTGAAYYRIYLNGEFQFYGPARGPHGYVRVDTIALPAAKGENTLAIELVGYAIPAFYSIELPSFVQAELYENGEPIRYTGRDFKGVSLTSVKLQKVWRYSYQRDFTEVWDLTSPLAGWKNGDFEGEELATVDYGCDLLKRGFRNPDTSFDNDAEHVCSGILKELSNGPTHLDRCMIPSKEVRCFKPEEITLDPIPFVDKEYVKDSSISESLSAGQYSQYNFGHITTGFIRTKLVVSKPAVVHVIFSELILNDRVSLFGDSGRNQNNIITYILPVGTHELESFECYSLMHVAVVVESGDVSVETVGLRRFVYPASPVSIKSDDPILKACMNAAFESFRQNTLDCFMDCPGRERGGWLCDSYFTAKASLLFTGDTDAERAFLDNFRLAKYFPNIPDGLLPMCYPGDAASGNTIPQWTMWFIYELAQFKQRGGDVAPFRPLLCKLLDFFAKHENEDGLLEKLPLWNFVEWSKANSWVQDVNYPTNMLYAGLLRGCADMLERPELIEKAERIAKTVREQSFDGSFFRDHAVRVDGKLVVQDDRSAICQHEAVLFDIIDPNEPQYETLRRAIIEDFGYGSKNIEGIEPLNAFIGFAVRVEVMMKLGLYEQNLREIKKYYGEDMAVLTGTLWEHTVYDHSLNHGFSSFIAPVIIECLEKLNG